MLALLLVFWTWIRNFSKQQTQIPCSNASSVEELITCLDNYTVPYDHFNRTTYDLAQPTDTQLADWTRTIHSMLGSDSKYVLDSPDFVVFPFLDKYAVLAEKNTPFEKGWGTFVVPLRPRSSVHFSAPHPAYDINTPQQAARLFETTHGRSLLISGRMRTAFMEKTGCVGGGKYWVTDPTHDVDEPFHSALIAIKDWQDIVGGGCSSSSCAYIQLHGKGPATCSLDQIFLSSGLGPSPWYTDPIDRPIKRLEVHLQQSFPSWNISLPTESACGLTATANVFGRYANGVPLSNLCSPLGAKAEDVTGHFIHMEQSLAARQEDEYEGWTEALRRTFKL